MNNRTFEHPNEEPETRNQEPDTICWFPVHCMAAVFVTENLIIINLKNEKKYLLLGKLK
jgi:hypothetical protein